MGANELSNAEKERAKELANALQQKTLESLNTYDAMSASPNSSLRGEIRAIRQELERMGFYVVVERGYIVTTETYQVEVTLYLPKDKAVH